MTITILLTFVRGRGQVFSGHPDLQSDDCASHYEEDAIQISIKRENDQDFTHLGNVENGEKALKIPGTNISVPFQEFVGAREMTVSLA